MQCRCFKSQVRLLEWGLGLGFSRDVDQLAIVGLVDLVGLDRDDRALAELQILGTIDGATFIPEDHPEGDEQHQRSGTDACDRLLELRKTAYFFNVRIL